MSDQEDEAVDRLLHDLARVPLVDEADINRFVEHGLVGVRHDRRGRITRAELRSAFLVSHGMTARMAGEITGNSAQTVQKHLDAARLSLGAKNTTHLIALCLRSGRFD